VTLRSAGATYSPRFRIVPSNDFAIECLTRRGVVLCDQPIAAREDPQILLRSTGELLLGAVAVNGERQDSRLRSGSQGCSHKPRRARPALRTARWLDAMTNAVDDPTAGGLGWR
jgi:hypothetical protein